MSQLATLYPITFTNTLTGNRERFTPLHNGQVRMYVCGITPYDYAHVGHGRCYVTFDVLFRLLVFMGYDVAYCRNFTDVDDKLIDRAQTVFGHPDKYVELAVKFSNAFHQDMGALGCLTPTYEPRVTEHIPQIIAFIQKLLDKNKAYVVEQNVYFSIDNFPEYGKLSKRQLDQMRAGARIQVRQDKHNPMDFALWKQVPLDEPGWQSPWGWGRPGWHIECSALANAYLGSTLDIHGGGMDLIFPHHENELAQSQGALEKPLAHYWLHVAFVEINAEKMSKSLGNFITLHDLRTRFDAMVIRYYFLQHQYRNPLDFSLQDLEASSKSYSKLCALFAPLSVMEITPGLLAQHPIAQLVLGALCEDLNTAKALGIIFENLAVLQQDTAQAALIKSLVQHIMGLSLEPLEKPVVVITAEIQDLLDARQRAREAKQWAEADRLRDKLKNVGFEVQDKKSSL